MAAISLSGLEIDPSSYVDPNGFVFSHAGELLRAIRPEREALYRRLFRDGTIDHLVRDSHLVETEISEHSIPELDCGLVLRHRRVSPLSYCVEWCPSMLKRAALATLELNLDLIDRGLILQDAYPWNVLFDGTTPVFVDFTSIVPIETHLLWPAYQQFLNFFVNPLELASLGKGRIARALLFDQIDGVSAADVRASRTPGWILRHPLRSMGEGLSARLSARVQADATLKEKLQDAAKSERFAAQNERLRRRFVDRLLRRVRKLRASEAADTWRGYYEEVSRDAQSDTKAERVGKLLDTLRPETVLDVGCNVGRYSVLAARSGARVVSVDSSEHCIEALFHTAEAEGLRITPVISDILSPVPAFGFLSRQFPPLVRRFRSEAVLCLGLMHHLHINGRQSFERIAKMLDELTERAVIFEFVGTDDGNIRRLDHGRPIDYTLESVAAALGEHFRISEFDSDRPSRRLLLCEK